MQSEYESVVKYIRTTSGVSIIEILRMLQSAGYDTDGDYGMTWPYSPVLIWTGINEETVEFFKRLTSDSRVEVVPTQPMVYFIDGEVPILPIANVKSVSKGYQYKKPHWLPVAFNRPRD